MNAPKAKPKSRMILQKTIKGYVTMVFAKTRRVPTIVFAVQVLVVSIVIMTFLNVCLLHVNTGVLAKIKLTPSNVGVLQVTKVCKAEFVQVFFSRKHFPSLGIFGNKKGGNQNFCYISLKICIPT